MNANRLKPFLLLGPLLIGGGTGCQGIRGGGNAGATPAPVPEPVYVQDLYPPTVDTPAQADPFAQPGVLRTIDDTAFGTPGTYTVRKGDTLWKIAAEQLGDGQRWREIVSANPGLEPKKLAVGQSLRLP